MSHGVGDRFIAPAFSRLLGMQVVMTLIGMAMVSGWSGPLPAPTISPFTTIVIALLATSCSCALMLGLYQGRWQWLSQLKNDVTLYSSILSRLTLPQLLCVGAMAGISEEWLFRAGLQQGFSLWMPEWMSILVTSLAFGICHAISRAYFIATFLIGLALGVAYAVTDSLWLVIFWHALHDIVFLVILRVYPHWMGLRSEDSRG